MMTIESIDEIKETIDTMKNMKVCQIIFSKDSDKCSLIIGTDMFSTLTIIPKPLALETGFIIRDKCVPLFIFEDSELPEAWKKSYAEAGIPEDEWDRRTEFHPYDKMTEMFCIDPYLLKQIMGSVDVPEWKSGAVGWYRSKMVYQETAES